ncbi:acyltransferase 3 family protein [Rhizobium phaseoli]|uniref:OpgC family protein n=1 Tax=Rhizobium phaseoli TaxID=396 RepID=UPI0007EA5B33|nr:OpgC domain-containing protein [Rhizobium phaseoli]ANL74093.1 acyltransferase 3 family protein [Rhizobium phaseoli]ANM06331.1 acyltransferase 3 family protein [Rhizobium phaseoli]
MASTRTEAIGTERSSRSVAAPGRDTRLDVLRGLALIMIFINHVPGQFFEYVTTKNFGFSDAAEAFVLISGIAVGLAYGTRFQPGNRIRMAIKAAKRAFTLYLAHMITTFMTLALFICGAWLFHRPGLLVEINILAVLMNLKEGIPALLLLGHQIGYNNILPMYGALLLMVPILLLLNERSPLLALAVSGTVWLLAGIYQVAPHNMLIEGYWFLNPLSWQFLFSIGIVSILHIKRGGRIPRHPLLLAVAAAYVVLSFVWVTGHLWIFGNSLAALGLPPVITGFDKTFLSLPRLLHVLALTYLIISIPAFSRILRRPADHPLTILGRHSLNIFVAGTILAMVGQVVLYITNKDPLVGPIFVIAGIATQFAYAYYLEHKRQQGKVKSKLVTEVAAVPVPVRIGGAANTYRRTNRK